MKIAQISGLFSSLKKLWLKKLTKYGFGYILGDFFTKTSVTLVQLSTF
jgi:hypothetical protein